MQIIIIIIIIITVILFIIINDNGVNSKGAAAKEIMLDRLRKEACKSDRC